MSRPVCQLDLHFARDTGGRTGIARRRISYPWALTQPFYLDALPAGMATVIPQSSSGGLFQGDEIGQRLIAAEGTAVHLTTQGATPVHANRNGRPSVSAWRLEARAGAWLEVVNDPLVLFPESDLRQSVTIEADPSAVVFYAEGFTWHPRPERPAFRRFESEVTVSRPAGATIAVERQMIDAAAQARELAATSLAAHGYGLMLLLADATARDLAPVRTAIGAALDNVDDVWAGVAALPNAAGLCVRTACTKAGALAPAHWRAWRAIRQVLLGAAPAPRRKEY